MTRRSAEKSRRPWRIQRRHVAIGVPVACVAIMLLVQVLYPSGRLLPWQRIDGESFGAQTKSDAAKQLDEQYRARTVNLYFGNAKKPQYTPKLQDFGLTVDNGERLAQTKYPWYLRLVPTSLFWAHTVVQAPTPDYTRDTQKLQQYLQQKLGGSCQVAPINATAVVQSDKIVAVEQEDGGTCEEKDVKKALQSLTPVLDTPTVARVAMKPIPAKLTTKDVQPTVDTLNTQLAKLPALTYDNKSEQVDVQEVKKWLVFDTAGDTLKVKLAADKSDKYLTDKFAKALERPAGVSKVTTRDFVEVSRVDGQVGRKLDTGKTLEHLRAYLLAESSEISVGDSPVEPQVQYTRSYSGTDAGLSALMKNYAESHPGVYGVSLIELDGKRRRAAFNDTQKFTTASTYKLYVAFSTLKRVESGEYRWSDQTAGGRTLDRCFDDMIVKSDNACAEALVARIGYAPITKDAQTIVSPNTTFLDRESYKTTAGDLSTFMASLATGQIPLKPESQAKFVDALKRNVYRQGVPAGASGPVADKVGFLEGLLHDAAIVYSPSGTYALSIMTDKSSWASIAELTREIEKLRNQ